MAVLMFAEKLRQKIDDAHSADVVPINNSVQQFRKKIATERKVAQETSDGEAFVLQLKHGLLLKQQLLAEFVQTTNCSDNSKNTKDRLSVSERFKNRYGGDPAQSLMQHHSQCESTLFRRSNALLKKHSGNHKSLLFVEGNCSSDEAIEEVTQCCSSYSSNSLG